MNSKNHYKVLIIGGGVIGCAMLEYISRHPRVSCLLIEKNGTLISGASSGNSGVLHCAFDAPRGR